MLRVLLGACLLAAATMADEHHVDESEFGCCSHEDRREILYLWESVWSASFTERKVMIAKAVFEELVIANSQWRNYNFCPPPGKHSLRALVHL